MKYVIKIDLNQSQIYGPVWREYGQLYTYGNSLEDCIKNAMVEIVDWGQEVWQHVRPDSAWMIDLIVQEFKLQTPTTNGDLLT